MDRDRQCAPQQLLYHVDNLPTQEMLSCISRQHIQTHLILVYDETDLDFAIA